MSEQTHHQQQELFLLLQLFDSFWSEFPIFTTKPPPTPSPTSLYPSPETTLDAKVERVPETSRPSKFPTALHSRSMSETDVTASPVSPDSVLSSTPKLETVLFGKEATEFYVDGGSSSVNAGEEMARPGRRERRTTTTMMRRKRIARTSSRSLSELEFEEVKGFMDLGFMFSERDRDSATLVSILPGLQRLDVSGEVRTAGVSRPYLSEAWGAPERQRKAPPTTKWRIPEIGKDDERVMKDQLRFWAQAVASAVR